MANCVKCGNVLNEGAELCPGCGAIIPVPAQQQYIQQPNDQQPTAQQPDHQQPYYQHTYHQHPDHQQPDYQHLYYQQPHYPYAPFTPVKKNRMRTLIITGIVVVGAILLMLGAAWLFNQLGDPILHGPPPEAYWIGLWRYEEDSEIVLFHAKPDGTFKVGIYNTKDDLHDTIEGRYEVSESLSFTAFDVTFNGKTHADGFAASFNYGDHTVLIGDKIFDRVPSEYTEAVLADPTAPYPPDDPTAP